jgi:hypothetical protein
MNDAWAWWLFFVGLGVGIAVYWLVSGRVRRTDEDEAADEQALEAEWISETIEAAGGTAPADLVGQVLDLHRRYLDGDLGTLAPEQAPPAELPASPADVASPAHPSADAGRDGRDRPDVERDRAEREPAEAHLGQAG